MHIHVLSAYPLAHAMMVVICSKVCKLLALQPLKQMLACLECLPPVRAKRLLFMQRWQRSNIHRLRQAKVTELHVTARVQQQVVRFDVPANPQIFSF